MISEQKSYVVKKKRWEKHWMNQQREHRCIQLPSTDTTPERNVTVLTLHVQHGHFGPLGTHGLRQFSTCNLIFYKN